MKLVIIEGVGKRPAIQKYLGSGYKVFATLGHVRDLPERNLAVDVDNNFSPTYVVMPDKKKIVTDLKAEAAKADEILLATDPDREGEAISWHIATILEIPENAPARITFNEISKKAIDKALASPRPIDRALVDAQQARRVLDRLVGYKLSPVLIKKIQNKLSAGRVQSPTLKLVVDREREIAAFKPEEYWPFVSILSSKGAKVKASLIGKNGKKIKLTSASEVEIVKQELTGKDYKVVSINKAAAFVHAPAPFKTSTMQQEAISKLNMTLKAVSSAAQELYEGVDIAGEGKVPLITYIRTDSTRVSPEAIQAARSFISEKYGPDYIPEKPNYYASKGNVQDAHEAIRPISLDRTPESLEKVLSKSNYKLYKLIYDRFLASQMSQAKYDTVSADVLAGEYDFKISGKTLSFPGFTVLYGNYEEDNGDDETNKKVPPMNEGDILQFV
ncbi:MAG: type I DNA topoisomerase, partial [Clostridia bacterium]|nr:type I DNA topoisomerase [Clostridia bacterium]